MNYVAKRFLAGSLMLAGCGVVSSGSAPVPREKQVAVAGAERIAEAPTVSTQRSSDGLKIDQVAVVRPKVAPGERAMLVARYSVATTAPIDVQEIRTVRYGDQVLVTREQVVKRGSGDWVSEYPLTIPSGAAEGLYS